MSTTASSGSIRFPRMRTGSHPELRDLAKVQHVMLVHQPSPSQNSAEFKQLERKYKVEKEKNRILDTRVNGLESMIEQFLLKMDEYQCKAVINERKIKELEARLVKEILVKKNCEELSEQLGCALESVKSLERQVELLEMKSGIPGFDENCAWKIVEEEAMKKKFESFAGADFDLTESAAYDVVESSLIKERIQRVLEFHGTDSSPSEHYANLYAENAQLRERLSQVLKSVSPGCVCTIGNFEGRVSSKDLFDSLFVEGKPAV